MSFLNTQTQSYCVKLVPLELSHDVKRRKSNTHTHTHIQLAATRMGEKSNVDRVCEWVCGVSSSCYRYYGYMLLRESRVCVVIVSCVVLNDESRKFARSWFAFRWFVFGSISRPLSRSLLVCACLRCCFFPLLLCMCESLIQLEFFLSKNSCIRAPQIVS